MTDGFRYKAFISYSHTDKVAGNKLLKDLENYRVPKRLVGKTAPAGGTIPGRVGQVFRDRDELPAAEDLTAEVKKALTQSEFMIVLCSPAAAASRWVNREIIEFKKLTGERRILSVILSGEPFASDHGAADRECFPPALRFRLGDNGMLTTTPAEPLAADFRAAGDGPRRGRLKLVAGLLGIGLDALIERDLQRKMRRVMVVTAASVFAMLGMGFLTYEAVTARQDAEHHRGEAEGLIEFMLTDLRDKLEPVGRLDVLDAVGEQAVAYYDRQALDDMPDDALGRRARAFHLLGEIDDKQGDLEGAHEKFEAAYLTTATQLAQDPDNTDRIFDHSQSAFWVGFLEWQLGNYKQAEFALKTYKMLSQALVTRDPQNKNWRYELAYSNSNLGTLSLRQFSQPEKALPFFQESLTLFKALAKLAPSDADAIMEVTDAYAWVADSYRMLGELLEARAHRQKELELYTSLVETHPHNMKALVGQANTRVALSMIDFDLGRIAPALSEMKSASKALEDFVSRDPENTEWRKFSAMSHLHLAEALTALGEHEQARRAILQVHNMEKKFTAESRVKSEIKYKVIALRRLIQAKLEYYRGNYHVAAKAVEELIPDLRHDLDVLLETNGGIEVLIATMDLQSRLHIDRRQYSNARSVLLEIKQLLTDPARSFSLRNQLALAKALTSLNEATKANSIINGLQLKSYRHPDFEQFETASLPAAPAPVAQQN